MSGRPTGSSRRRSCRCARRWAPVSAGLVAETGRPEATADYAGDHRLVHLRELDDRVDAEGLKAIVAAPLRRAQESLGVLLAASRAVRRFTPEETAVCASLGAHAAVAIENARLRLLATTQERLTAVALNGRGLQDLLDEGARCVAGRIELRDASGELMTSAGTAGDEAQHCFRAELGAARDLGTINMLSGPPLGIEQEVADRLAGFTASLLLQQREQSEARVPAGIQMLEELLLGQGAIADGLRRWLARTGAAMTSPHVVLIAATGPPHERWSWLSLARAAATEHALVGTVAGRVVAVVPGDEADIAARRSGGLIRRAGSLTPTIGAAITHTGMHGAPTAYREAHAAMSLLLGLGRHGQAATTARLGILGHMLSEPGRADLPLFIARILGPLIAHDETSHSPLLPVLAAYFRESGHLARTAQRPSMHVNTLYLRIDRINEILGADWRTPDRLLELQLATRLRKLDLQLRNQAAAELNPSSPGPSDAK